MAAQVTTATLISFPRPRAHIGAALKRHRLPEGLAAALARESEGFAEVSAHAALAYALDQRMASAPLDIEQARGILLAGPVGSGKSAVAAKIVRAARLAGRRRSPYWRRGHRPRQSASRSCSCRPLP